jgi:hypothetical protein
MAVGDLSPSGNSVSASITFHLAVYQKGGSMELSPLYKRVIGLDVHQAQITACALIEDEDGAMRVEQRQFGAFQRDRQALAEWALALHPDQVVMESTGIYWKSPYAALGRSDFMLTWSMPATSRMSLGEKPI